MAIISIASRTTDDPLQTALDHIAAHRDDYHRAGELDAETFGLLQAAGLFRALVPQSLGGDERLPADFLRMVERVAAVDGSAGWIASLGSWKAVTAALPPETYAALHEQGPDVFIASSGFPFEPAQAVEGGYRISGRRHFSSGLTVASHVAVGIVTADGDRLAVLPREAVTILPGWDVVGLRGTGSYDIRLDNVFVPTDWTFLRGAQPSIPLPVYRYPVMPLSAQAFAVVGLGVARGALDALAGLVAERQSLIGGPVLAEKAHVQIALAKEEAALRAARALLYEETDRVTERALGGTPITREDRAALRIAASHAAATACTVARAAFEQAGSAGIHVGHPLARRMQDASVVAQHALLGAATWQSAGQVLLGQETPKGYP